MKCIDVRPVVGGDIRYWSISGETVHFSHHMYYNSIHETDSDCGNCDGGRCEGCRKIVVPEHLEFSIYTDHLAKVIEQVTPELTSEEISYLCHNDFSHNKVYHEGELYELVLPTEYWLKENHPELVNKLKEIIHMVEIEQTIDDKQTRTKFRFDTEEEAIKFLETEREKYKNMHGIIPGTYVPRNDTDIFTYFAKYEPDKENGYLSHVAIFRNRCAYADFLHRMYNGFLHYNGKIYHYNESKIDDVTESLG